MGVELLTNGGRVIGAIGLNTRTGELTAFLAKATILSTGEQPVNILLPMDLLILISPPLIRVILK
jgi:hypothetical protein